MDTTSLDIAQYIEHTVLKPTVTQSDIEKLIEEAKTHSFFGVCVPPYWVKKVKRDLAETDIQVVTVIGFPLGFQHSRVKLAEIEQAIADGADELDLVMNLTAFKSDADGWTKVEIAQCAKLAHAHEKILKVIVETAYLSDEELEKACKICTSAGVDIVKTSTGFAPNGAQKKDIDLMRKVLPESVGIKASRGIKTYSQAIELIEVGADRIGTSSGVAIVNH